MTYSYRLNSALWFCGGSGNYGRQCDCEIFGGQTLIQWMSVANIKNSDSKINNDEL